MNDEKEIMNKHIILDTLKIIAISPVIVFVLPLIMFMVIKSQLRLRRLNEYV